MLAMSVRIFYPSEPKKFGAPEQAATVLRLRWNSQGTNLGYDPPYRTNCAKSTKMTIPYENVVFIITLF